MMLSRMRSGGAWWPWSGQTVVVLAVLVVGTAFQQRPVVGQVVRGVVVERATRKPIARITVSLVGSDSSTPRTAVTDGAGVFRFAAPAGVAYRLRVVEPAYTEVESGLFVLSSGDSIDVTVELVPKAVQADSVAVGDAGRWPYLESVGFFERQRRGRGTFLTPAEVDRRKPVRASDLFYGMAGVQVVRDEASGPSRRVLLRGASTTSTRGICYPSVMIDGSVVRDGGMEPGTPLDDLVPAERIRAVEVYPGNGGLPGRLSGQTSPCGAILIWTRQ